MVEMVNLLAKAWMDDPEITVPFPERIRRAGLSPHSEHLSKANVSSAPVPNPEQKNSLVSDELRAISLTRDYWTIGIAQVVMQCSAVVASVIWWRMDGDGEEWIPPVPPCGGNGREDARRVSRAAAAAIGG